MIPKLHNEINELFGIDIRSLAFFRICLAIVLLADLIIRSSDLAVHYTDWGLLPRGVLLDKFLNSWYISLHLISGKIWVQAVLFILAACFALSLLVGYRTRLSTGVSWFLLISLHARNPMVLQGGDDLLRMLLFWSIFVPLGASYSLDAALRTEPEQVPNRVISAGTIALLAQVVIMYVFTALQKSGVEWRDGTAVYYALSVDMLARPLGVWLLRFPGLLSLMTSVTWWSELLGPALLFFPIRTGPIRTMAVAAFILLQIGFMLSMFLGLFPFIAIIAMLPFLPSWFWDKIFKKHRSPARAGLTLYYDGDCSFCKKSVFVLRAFFRLREVPITPAQTIPHVYRDMERYRSWVVMDGRGHQHYRFEGFLMILRSSPWAWPLSHLLMFRPIFWVGTRLYMLVAQNRRQLSHITGVFEERPLWWRLSKPANVLAVSFLIYVLAWNLGELNSVSFEIPTAYKNIGWALRLNQKWGMFSPSPFKDDGWYVIPGTLRNGTEVDIFRGGATVSWEKPESVIADFKNYRWRIYLRNIWLKKHEDHRLYYGKSLCRTWNAQHTGEETLETFQIYYVKEETPPPGKLAQTQPIRIWRHYCFKIQEN